MEEARKKEEGRKKRENEIKSQLFTDDVFNNIQVPEIKPIVKKEEKKNRRKIIFSKLRSTRQKTMNFLVMKARTRKVNQLV